MSPVRSSLSEAAPWIVPLRATATAKVSLICVPHSGAGASAFAPWARTMPEDVALLAVQLPGRETRFRERPLARMTEIVAALAEALAPSLEQPYTLFGHSFGAVVVFELAREIARRRLPPPVYVGISGRAAPHVEQHAARMHELPDAELMREVARRYGNIPAIILGDPEMWRVFLAPLRGDLAALETHEFSAAPAIPSPLMIFGGRDDLQTHLADLAEWGRYGARGCSVHLFPGGHFFLQSDREAVLQRLIAALDLARRQPVDRP